MADKLSNTVHSVMGGAKESIGKAIGNEQLAAKGASEKAKAHAAQAVNDAKTSAAKAQGNIAGAVDGLTGNNKPRGGDTSGARNY
ncbi:hypothetical protein BGZ73_002243 [Actinomortierella ambigua]|nr:hypothetical protein BGZ73_002243 [Actinomortierella ambigua]